MGFDVRAHDINSPCPIKLIRSDVCCCSWLEMVLVQFCMLLCGIFQTHLMKMMKYDILWANVWYLCVCASVRVWLGYGVERFENFDPVLWYEINHHFSCKTTIVRHYDTLTLSIYYLLLIRPSLRTFTKCFVNVSTIIAGRCDIHVYITDIAYSLPNNSFAPAAP